MRTSLLVLAAGAGALAYRMVCERERRGEKQALKSDIRKWEDEGGQVPQVPPVSPVITPESSVPDDR
jgi:hypothetical protein